MSENLAREILAKTLPIDINGYIQFPLRFDGSDYSPKHDNIRLTGQLLRVYECMRDGQWRTLDEIARITGDPHASISAQLRHLRKPRFGGHTIDKRIRGDRDNGLWEYRFIERTKL